MFTSFFSSSEKEVLESIVFIFLPLFPCRPSSEIDDKAVSEFTDEDTFLISLDYNAEKGLCNVVLESS